MKVNQPPAENPRNIRLNWNDDRMIIFMFALKLSRDD